MTFLFFPCFCSCVATMQDKFRRDSESGKYFFLRLPSPQVFSKCKLLLSNPLATTDPGSPPSLKITFSWASSMVQCQYLMSLEHTAFLLLRNWILWDPQHRSKSWALGSMKSSLQPGGANPWKYTTWGPQLWPLLLMPHNHFRLTKQAIETEIQLLLIWQGKYHYPWKWQGRIQKGKGEKG